MNDLRKVDSSQIYDICKNIVVSLLSIVVCLVVTEILPFYFAPVIGLGTSAFLFTLIYNNRLRGGCNCMLVPYTLFFCTLGYSFLSILANVFYIWGWMNVPDEFIFFNDPFMPVLWFNPIAFVTSLIVYLRRKRLRVCIECRLNNGSHVDRGVFGSILNTESRLQLKNLLLVFGVCTVVVWMYYIFEYQAINTNPKDRYIFFWITIIILILDITYFLYRYYNLFLDLKENHELITPEEMQGMTVKTYLRYYVICGNKVYLNPESEDATIADRFGIDTPFFIQREAGDINNTEVQRSIRELTGGKEGELRFFFGRRTPDIAKHFVLRFFYFLDGNPEDYEEMNAPGGWFDFEEVKEVYNRRPDLMATLAVNDLTRLATIVVTEKTYKENGQRRNKLKHYRPSFDLIDVRESTINFQDDKWMKVSLFNADKPFFRIRRWLHKMYQGKNVPRTPDRLGR